MDYPICRSLRLDGNLRFSVFLRLRFFIVSIIPVFSSFSFPFRVHRIFLWCEA